MRSKELALEKYDTDKMASGYLERYDEVFDQLVNQPLILLELGVHKGGSLLLWRDYFPLATIAGIDRQLPEGFHDTERIHLFEGSQEDTAFLSSVSREIAPNGFDIIIDDASHIGELTKAAFWHLFDHHLKPGGLYVVEDWGTGYWDDWLDGHSLNLDAQQKASSRNFFLLKARNKLHLKKPMKCHGHGMAGFVKQLVDEQAAEDVTRDVPPGGSARKSRFEKMVIYPSLVFVRKAGAGTGAT